MSPYELGVVVGEAVVEAESIALQSSPLMSWEFAHVLECGQCGRGDAYCEKPLPHTTTPFESDAYCEKPLPHTTTPFESDAHCEKPLSHTTTPFEQLGSSSSAQLAPLAISPHRCDGLRRIAPMHPASRGQPLHHLRPRRRNQPRLGGRREPLARASEQRGWVAKPRRESTQYRVPRRWKEEGTGRRGTTRGATVCES